MIIKKIVGLCKKSKQIRIMEGEETQWISDGYAMYPLYGAPHFDGNSFCAAYDIGNKAREKMDVRSGDALLGAYNFSDFDEEEAPCGTYGIGEILGKLVPLKTSTGLMFVQKEYLEPLADYDRNEMMIYERRDKNGRTYFAVKVGIILEAIIMPYDAIREELAESLETLAEQCKISLENMATE